MKKRPYKMRQRAESQEQTRQRIVEATAELHGSVGPRDTTISAVAELAGVQRLTVYRHFPDEESLFKACSSHWLSVNPPPNASDWADVENGEQKTSAALNAIYHYYSDTCSMWSLVYRDSDLVPAMEKPLEEFHAYLDQICDRLCTSWHPRGRRPRKLDATVRHVLRFSTWSSLDELELDDAEKADLALRWISSASR
jgi:AcrR family transcriptional regulator